MGTSKYWLTLAIIFGGLLLGLATQPLHLPAQSPESDEPGRGGHATRIQEMREGDLLPERTGIFRENSGRLEFHLTDTSTKTSFRVLENLALERVSRVIEEKPGYREWSVSGEVTEYRGSLFLLIHRAVLKSKSVRS